MNYGIWHRSQADKKSKDSSADVLFLWNVPDIPAGGNIRSKDTPATFNGEVQARSLHKISHVELLLAKRHFQRQRTE